MLLSSVIVKSGQNQMTKLTNIWLLSLLRCCRPIFHVYCKNALYVALDGLFQLGKLFRLT